MSTSATPNRISRSTPMWTPGSTVTVSMGRMWETIRGVSPHSSSPIASNTVSSASVAISREIAGALRNGLMMRKWVATPIATPSATDSAKASTVGMPSSRHT